MSSDLILKNISSAIHGQDPSAQAYLFGSRARGDNKGHLFPAVRGYLSRFIGRQSRFLIILNITTTKTDTTAKQPATPYTAKRQHTCEKKHT